MQNKIDCIPLLSLIKKSYELLYAPYLDCLTTLSLKPAPCTKPLPISFIRIATTATINTLNNFTPLLNALHNLNEALVYIIQSIKDKEPMIYIGIKSKDLNTAITLLTTGLLIAYPSIQIEVISEPEATILLNEKLLNPCECTSLSLANFIPLTQPESLTNSLTKDFISLMGSTSYTVFLLSTTVKKQCIYDLIALLQNLSTRLSQFLTVNSTSLKRKVTNENRTDTEGKNLSETHTTCNTTTCTTSNNLTSGKNNAYSATPKVANTLPTSLSTSCNTSSTIGKSNTTSESLTDSDTKAYNNSFSNTCGTVSEEGFNRSYRKDDKTVSMLINQIAAQLSRLYGLLYTNVFDFAAYFIAPEPATNVRAAYTYMNLFSDSSLNLQPNTINTWYQCDPDFDTLFCYLRRLSHPIFINDDCNFTTATLPIGILELQSLIYIPLIATKK